MNMTAVETGTDRSEPEKSTAVDAAEGSAGPRSKRQDERSEHAYVHRG